MTHAPPEAAATGSGGRFTALLVPRALIAGGGILVAAPRVARTDLLRAAALNEIGGEHRGVFSSSPSEHADGGALEAAIQLRSVSPEMSR